MTHVTNKTTPHMSFGEKTIDNTWKSTSSSKITCSNACQFVVKDYVPAESDQIDYYLCDSLSTDNNYEEYFFDGEKPSKCFW